MNYWPADTTNLAECFSPVFDMIKDLMVTGARTAQVQYGVGGWVAHHNTDAWRGSSSSTARSGECGRPVAPGSPR
jgi:alpha-L-fucosidase 2